MFVISISPHPGCQTTALQCIACYHPENHYVYNRIIIIIIIVRPHSIALYVPIIRTVVVAVVEIRIVVVVVVEMNNLISRISSATSSSRGTRGKGRGQKSLIVYPFTSRCSRQTTWDSSRRELQGVSRAAGSGKCYYVIFAPFAY